MIGGVTSRLTMYILIFAVVKMLMDFFSIETKVYFYDLKPCNLMRHLKP